MLTEELQRLRHYAKAPRCSHHLKVSPVIDAFIQSRADLFQCSKSEFWRRLAMEALEKWLISGLYVVPREFQAPPRAVRRGTPHLLRRVKPSSLDFGGGEQE
jgi:hypothetical protein